jgi:hypothetical protein
LPIVNLASLAYMSLPLTVNDLHELIPLLGRGTIVTSCPVAITTSSKTVGTTPPDQVVVAVQLPVAAEVIVVAEIVELRKHKREAVRNKAHLVIAMSDKFVEIIGQRYKFNSYCETP